MTDWLIVIKMCPIGERFQSVLCCSDGETLQTPHNRFGQVQTQILSLGSRQNVTCTNNYVVEKLLTLS